MIETSPSDIEESDNSCAHYFSRSRPIKKDEPNRDIYRCWISGVDVKADDVVLVGPVIQGLNWARSIHKDVENSFRIARREEMKNFHEQERNCNTCKNLQRVKSEKAKGLPAFSAPLYGICLSESNCISANNHASYGSPERYGKDVFAFFPEDNMNMPCYESRYFEEKDSK